MERDDKKEGKDVTVEDGSEFVSKTIVGGRPRRRRTYRMNIPAGIEKILYVASIDPAFRARLLEDRAGTLASRRIRLTPSESAVLESVPSAMLGHMIDQIRPKMHGKRRFMRAVAVAAVTLATGTAGMACEDGNPGPADVPAESEDVLICDPGDVPLDVADSQDEAGDLSDIPDEVDDADAVEADLPTELTDTVADAGVEPDLPDADEGAEEAD